MYHICNACDISEYLCRGIEKIARNDLKNVCAGCARLNFQLMDCVCALECALERTTAIC